MNDAPDHGRRRSRGLIRPLARLALLCGLAWLLVVVVFAWEQRSLIYQPEKGPVTPAQWGLGLSTLEEIAVATDDGLLLHGWLLFADHPSEDHARRLVILFSGNAGHRGYRVPILRGFQSLGWDSLICDYRGFAENTGRPTEELLAKDARTIWNDALGRGYRPGDIVLCGQSLGGGVAARLASELCREGLRPAGLILRATFTSLVDMGRYHYPWLPNQLILLDRFASLEFIGQIDCPILMVHGVRDNVVPYDLGRRLFRAAPEAACNGVPKLLLTLPDAGHDDLMLQPPREEFEVWRKFLQSVETCDSSKEKIH